MSGRIEWKMGQNSVAFSEYPNFTFFFYLLPFLFPFYGHFIGTTWTQEMVWCIMNDFNYAEGKKATLDEKFPYFE
jgi:hypothetical protein